MGRSDQASGNNSNIIINGLKDYSRCCPKREFFRSNRERIRLSREFTALLAIPGDQRRKQRDQIKRSDPHAHDLSRLRGDIRAAKGRSLGVPVRPIAAMEMGYAWASPRSPRLGLGSRRLPM
jgi:hypothetical protein